MTELIVFPGVGRCDECDGPLDVDYAADPEAGIRVCSRCDAYARKCPGCGGVRDDERLRWCPSCRVRGAAILDDVVVGGECR